MRVEIDVGVNRGSEARRGGAKMTAALVPAEPEEVFAMGVRHGETGFSDFDDTVSVSLRFPNGRLAQFVVSYNANLIDQYTLVGTKGSLVVSPGYIFGHSLGYTLKIGDQETTEKFANTDQFGGELKYFSECILDDRKPEPSAIEGFADVRVAEAIHEALRTGVVQKLPSFTKSPPIRLNQPMELPPVKAQKVVEVPSPTEG